MALRVKVGSNSWKDVIAIRVKVAANSWKDVIAGRVKIAANTWVDWFGSSLSPQNPVTISQSTNGTTYLITLTGTNYYWSPGPPSLTYYFEWSTNDGASWTTLSTGSAVNPAYGSSTSYTHQITTAELSGNVTNTYRFRIAATYGSQSASSSATTTVQGPTNVTLTAGTAGPTSIPLSWTASTGANRYMIYYDTTNPPTTLYAGTSSLSTTVSGLTSNTSYYFKVTPITGQTNNTGYSGNNSNVVNISTVADLTSTVNPTISGTLTEGQTITMSNGSWNLTPDSYNYQWLYYDQPGAGFEGYVPISGATSSSYTIPLNYRDIYGQYIRARVTANKSGYTSKNAYSTGQTVAYDATIPDPPTGLSVTDVGTNRPYNNAAYSLSWTAPSNTGGVSLTGYKIQYQVPSTGTTWFNWSSNTVDTSSNSITLTGFGSNLSTNFRVYSVNSVGQSATAVSTSSAILGTTVPQAPTIGTASSFNTYISVTYTANSTGGKAINTYTATSSPGSLTGSTSSGAILVSGVTHNTAYTFTVTATNANGTSAASSSSNIAYGVNIGTPVVNSFTRTTTSITLNFTVGTNSTSTRGYLNNSLDGSTSGSSYTFVGLASNTSYSLGLSGTATVNGVFYEGSRVTNTYSTLAPPAVTVNSYPTISGSGQAGTNITFNSGSYNNASSVTKTLRATTTTSFNGSVSSKGSTSPYTITTLDAQSPAYYFATLDTVIGTNGTTYYFWSGGYSGFSATIPAGSGSILSYPAPVSTAGTTTASATNTAGAGGRFDFSNTTYTNANAAGITYYWTLGTSTNFTAYNALTANTSGVVTTARITPLVFRVYSQFTGTDGVVRTSNTAQVSVTFT